MTIAEKDKEFAQFRTSVLLERSGFRHAFFTRHGGVSSGAYRSLSFSVVAGDAPANVERNLERAGAALGVDAARVYYLSQVHGRTAITLDGTEDRAEVVLREGDAIVGRRPGCAFGVRMADCVPILVGDRRSGAVAAIHAGWKGLVAGVIGAGVEALRRVAAGSGDLVAAIGPHISGPAFEVSEDVADQLAACAHGRSVVERAGYAKPHVRLVDVAAAQLEAAGLAARDVDRVEGCTYLEPSDFFSFRRDGAKSGRHLAAIVPR